DTTGSLARTADLAAHRRHPLDERDQLRDVVAVAAGDGPSERDPGRVYEKVMLGAVSGPVNWARAVAAPLFSLARGWRARPRAPLPAPRDETAPSPSTTTTRSHPPTRPTPPTASRPPAPLSD